MALSLWWRLGQGEQRDVPGKEKRKVETTQFRLKLAWVLLASPPLCQMCCVAGEGMDCSHHLGHLSLGLTTVGPTWKPLRSSFEALSFTKSCFWGGFGAWSCYQLDTHQALIPFLKYYHTNVQAYQCWKDFTVNIIISISWISPGTLCTISSF